MNQAKLEKKNALITGITGQDGAYLASLLLEKNYNVFGTYRRSSTPNFWRLQWLNIFEKVKMIPADLTDMGSLMEAITISEPCEIYNLGAQSFVGASFEQPQFSTEVNGIGPLLLLEAIRLIDKGIKFYQASTSEIYGNSFGGEKLLDENSIMKPISPYAAAKLNAYHMVDIYRDAYGIFASNGILFNHESPLRGLEFVTRKVTNSVAKISLGLQDGLTLGNMDSKRDWGFAPEYVEAMWLMLQHSEPNNFVIASGETHSIHELVKSAFNAVGIKDYEQYINIDPQFNRPLDINVLIGDSRKAKTDLKWEQKTNFEGLITIMAESDLQNWKRYLKGDTFPWDAPNYPTEANIQSRTVRL
jgi:GDPmannose 4,6-dehydratase